MEYMTTATNQSPVMTEILGQDMENIRGKAVKFNSEGAIVLAGVGDLPVGIGVITNDTELKAGDRVDIQVKDMGVVLAGGAFTKGAALTCDKDGALVEATAGSHVIAIALEKAQGTGAFIKALFIHYEKLAATVPAGENDNQ